MPMTVAQVDAIVKAAPSGEIVLPIYQGLPGDLDYLRNYVLAAVTDRYKVDASVFDTANLLSTTILRDFLHRAVYDHDDLPIYQDVHTSDPNAYKSDVGALFRENVWVQCGLIAWQLENIYDAFGYQSSVYWTFNGEDGTGTPYSYDDGHVRVDVKLDDYGKYITQDPTYNWLFVDGDTSQPLSYREAQKLNFTDPADLVFDDTGIRTYVGTLGIDGVPAGLPAYYRSDYMKVNYAWMNDGLYSEVDRNMSLDWYSTHTGVFEGAYASANAAIADVMSLHDAGKTLVGITDALRPDHGVSGFRLLSLDGQSIVGDFVTLQLTDGSYVSINIDTGQALNGSYDQIMDDLTGANRNLNPGIDTSAFFNPAIFVLYNGEVAAQWDIPENNFYVASMVAQQNSRVTITQMPDGHFESNYWDAYDAPWSHMTEYYTADHVIYFREMNFDNGDYSARYYDNQNKQPYAYYEVTGDHTGQLIATNYVYDDGTSFLTKLDPTNKASWSREELHYNAANQLTSDAIKGDDGSWIIHHFDPAGAFAWTSYDTWMDPKGRITHEVVKYDDGHTTFTAFDFPLV